MVDYRDEISEGEWRSVNSTHLSSIMWVRTPDASGKLRTAVGRLYIEFNEPKRRIYVYNGVSYGTYYYLWKQAPSKGKYFHRTLRGSTSKKGDVGQRAKAD